MPEISSTTLQPALRRLGTPLSPSATRVMLLGAGELGKEVLIALQRLGIERSPSTAMPTRQACRWRIAHTWYR